MCVIPFDRERPFPLRDRNRAVVAGGAACAAFGAELARFLEQNAALSERLRRAEARADDAMASLMHADLVSERTTRLPQAG